MSGELAPHASQGKLDGWHFVAVASWSTRGQRTNRPIWPGKAEDGWYGGETRAKKSARAETFSLFIYSTPAPSFSRCPRDS